MFASDPKPGAPAAAAFQQIDLRSGQVATGASPTPGILLGGRPNQVLGDGPYLWYTPARGSERATELSDDPEGKYGNRPRLTAALASTPPAALLRGHEGSSWYAVGNPAGDFALVEGMREGKTSACRMLVYRRGEDAWSWTELDGADSRAMLMGRFVLFEEARPSIQRDDRGRIYYGGDVPTGRSKIVSLDSGDVLEVKMEAGRVMWADSSQILIKSGKELWLMSHNLRKITTSRLLARRDTYFDLCLYAFPVEAKPTAVQMSAPKTPLAAGR